MYSDRGPNSSVGGTAAIDASSATVGVESPRRFVPSGSGFDACAAREEVKLDSQELKSAIAKPSPNKLDEQVTRALLDG